MSLLSRLGLSRADPPSTHTLTSTIRARLDRLPAARAEYVAAFAGLLVRIAYADRAVAEPERAALRTQLVTRAGLTPEEAETVADLVVHEAIAGIEYSALTRTFNEVASEAEKEQLLDCLYAVATADDTASLVEDDEIRAVAHALMLSHEQFIAVRLRYKDKLEILQGLRSRPKT